jgi:2,4-dienoyl-CoA reductase-like NADH-dependent reductase (Old Yellow Enzyme family)
MITKFIGQSVWQEQSEHLDKLSEAAGKAFGMIGNVVRNKVSHYAKKDRSGQPIPDYADLASCFEAIRKAYSTHGLSVRQTFHPFGDDGTIYLVTTIRHSSGQFERSYLPMKGNIPPQELAKTATYLKRIALCAAAGIAADDDDDGEQADKSHQKAAVVDEKRIERALVSKVRSSKTAEEAQAVVEQAERGVAAQQLSLEALGRVRLAATDITQRLREKAEADTKKTAPEPVPA